MTNPKIVISDITADKLQNGEYFDFIPELYHLKNFTENSLWHDHQTVFDHVIKVFKNLETFLDSIKNESFISIYLSQKVDDKTRKELLIISTLLHDIAKGKTLVISPDGTAKCPGHELVGASQVKHFAERFNLTPKQTNIVERIVRYHTLSHDLMTSMIVSGDNKKYFDTYQNTIGDVTLEIILLTLADIKGSDLEQADAQQFQDRVEVIDRMIDQLKKQK